MSKIDKVLATLQSKENANNVEDLNEVKELVNLLSKRRVKLREWMEKAWAYYNEGKNLSFVELLESAVVRGAKSYVDYKTDLLRANMMLMAYFVRLAFSEPGDKRAVWKEKVTNLLQTVDNMQANVSDVQHTLCRGFAHILIDARLQEADNYFVTVLRQVPHDVTALLGRACLAYNRQEYRLALGYLKHLLLHHPEGPSDVRVGVAHCFLKLGDLVSARAAFDLALAKNERSLNAMLGIAQMKLNEHTLATNMEAINKLCGAFELNQRHPIVLSWLSSYLYYARDYNTLNSIAGNAYAATDSEELKSQNCFQIARSFHASQNFARAFDFYGMALTHYAGYAPPHLGVAQMYIRRGQLDKAEISLRNLLKLLPDQSQALRMLAILFAQSDSETKQHMAVQLFTKAAKDEHYENYLGLAATYKRKQLWQEALDAYDQAIRIYQRMHGITHDVPLTWLNNVAALQMHAGKTKAALQTLDKALSMTPDATQEHYESNLLTLRFNRARVLEELNLVEQAENSYQQLIVEYPNYYDCYLRLGFMAYKRNKPKLALERFQAVLQLDSENEAANICMGNYLVREGDLEQAISKYNVAMRRNSNAEDSYMLVAMGNVSLNNLQRAIDEGNQEMTKLQMQNALQLFKKALDKNHRNLWAANGIGVVLCCQGYLSEGETIFKQILDSGKRCPDAILNSAHAALQLDHYAYAIDTYKQCLRNVPFINCVKVLQLLARSLFQAGRIKEAKEWLLKALHITPQNPTLYYNLAIVIKQDGSDKFANKDSNLEDLKKAEFDIKLAQGFFNFLTEKGEFLRSATIQANLCTQLLDNAPAELKNWRLQEEQRKLEKLKKIEQEKMKELFTKPNIIDREPSTKRKRDREPSTRRKKTDREPSTKPKNTDRESSVKSRNTERESSVKPKALDRETAVKAKSIEREASVKPQNLEREAAVKAKNFEREESIKPKTLETAKNLERETSVKPKPIERESSVAPAKSFDRKSYTIPKVYDRDSSTKPKSVEAEPTVPTDKAEKAAALPKTQLEEVAKKPSPKEDAKSETQSPESKSRKKSKKRKHKSKKKKSSDSRESSSEPKDKEKKK